MHFLMDLLHFQHHLQMYDRLWYIDQDFDHLRPEHHNQKGKYQRILGYQYTEFDQ